MSATDGVKECLSLKQFGSVRSVTLPVALTRLSHGSDVWFKVVFVLLC